MINIFNIKINKYLILILLTVSTICLVLFALNESTKLNNLVFNNIINPYNPLAVNKDTLLNKTSVNNESWQDPRGLFPIFAVNIPDFTDKISSSLKVIENGGINIIINGNFGWMPDPYKMKSAFKELGKTNLRWLAIIENECKNDFIYRNSNDEKNSNIKKYLKDFNDDFIYGWFIWDEPGGNRKLCTPLNNIVPNDDNADINRMVKQVRSDSLYNKKLDYINLFPMYWDGTPTAEDYENYIDAFISSQEYKPRLLSIDNYPFLRDEFGGFRRDYFLNLEILRKKSLQYNLPFWVMLLSSGHLDYKKPTFEEISFQVYSALAYGAKGIGYYLYSKSWERVGYTSWILEDYLDNPNVADSLHGPLYVPVQKLNENIQTLGEILTKLKSIEVIHTSDYPNKQKEITQSLFKSNQSGNLIKKILYNDNANTDSKLLIGVFEEMNNASADGKYLLIVNKDAASSSQIIVSLNKMYRIFKFKKETGEKKFINTNENITSTISAGSGELFYIE